MKDPLRIGYVVKRFPRLSETFVAQEILELERRGVEVTVYRMGAEREPVAHAWIDRIRARVVDTDSLSSSRIWDSLGARHKRSGHGALAVQHALSLALDHPLEKSWRYLRDAVSIAQDVERNGLHHLHAHFASRPAFTAALVHLLAGVPFSFTAHAKDIYAFGLPAELWRRQVELAAFAVTVAEANARYLREIVGEHSASRLRVLYNGVDLETLRPSEDARSSQSILCVCRLVEKKGVDILLQALSILARSGKPIPCDIVGDGAKAEELRHSAAALGLQESVRFSGALRHEEVMALLRSAGALVLPCRVAPNGDRDALPTVLLEAMAVGLPCISTAVGGVPEIIADGETGFVVPCEDAAALAAAISKLQADPPMAARLGVAGRRRAELLFDRRHNVAVLHGWFLEATGRTDDGEGHAPASPSERNGAIT